MELLTSQERRFVKAPTDTVRRELIRGLEDQGFTVGFSRGTHIDARCGKAWLPRLGSRRGPMRASLTVIARAAGTEVLVALAETEAVLLDLDAALDSYTHAFSDVVAQLDARLRALDPTVDCPPTPAPAVHVGAVDRRAQLNRLGRHTVSSLPTQHLVQAGTLAFVHGELVAKIDVAFANRLVGVAATVSADPSIPPGLAQRLVDLYHQVKTFLRDPVGTVIDLDKKGSQLLEFVHCQVVIRGHLPERELHRCNDCGSERLVNPELTRRGGRRRLRSNLTVISSSAAGMLLGSPTSAITLAGRLVGLGSAGEQFTCGRCQGNSAETIPATICPRCRSIQSQPVLRICVADGCGYDFGAVVVDHLVWAQAAPPSEPTSTADPAPIRPDAGWYADPSGRHEWRWWTGERWAALVSSNGEVGLAPPAGSADA